MTENPNYLEYTGQSLDDILDVVSSYTADAVVRAIGFALQDKITSVGIEGLTSEELVGATIAEVEYCVGCDGFAELFWHNSRDFVPFMVRAFRTVGCEGCACIAREAIAAMGESCDFTAESVSQAFRHRGPSINTALIRCDESLWDAEDEENLLERLIEYVEENRSTILAT
jgi:hypothetical protein